MSSTTLTPDRAPANIWQRLANSAEMDPEAVSRRRWPGVRRLWRAIRSSRRRDGSSRRAPGHPAVPDRPRRSDCARLAGLIERDGIESVEDELPFHLARGEAARVPSLLLQIAADPTEPAIARARAFGRICRELAADRRGPSRLRR